MIALIAAFLFSVQINSLKASSEEGKFNPGETILHHVMDAHEIHIAGNVAIPLPVILWDGGPKFYLSSSFYDNPVTHGSHTYFEHDGYVLYHEQFYKAGEHGIEFHEGHPSNASVMDFSITKNTMGMLIGLAVMLWIFLKIAKAYNNTGLTSAPKGLQSVVEPLILFIRDEVAKPAIGKKYERFMPYLLTVFFFIFFLNLLGLIPFLGGMNVTGNIAVTMVLALITFVITSLNANKGYWMHIVAPPGVPLWLLPIMLPIEIIGVFSKPFVLMLRLFANVTAGHIIILAFVSLIFIFNEKYGSGAAYGASVLSLVFSIFMNVLELLVAFLQAYVFTLLSALYFGAAVEEHHHDEAHEVAHH